MKRNAWWFVCRPRYEGTRKWLLSNFLVGRRCDTSGKGIGREGPETGDLLICYLAEPSSAIVATAVALRKGEQKNRVDLRLRHLLRIPLGWPTIRKTKNLSRIRRMKSRQTFTKLEPKEFTALKRLVNKLNPNTL